MVSFEYNIGINENGRPVIEPTERTDKELHFVEHKFMGLEIARSVIENTIKMHEENPEKWPLPVQDYEELKLVLKHIQKVSDIFASTILNQNNVIDMSNDILSKSQYDFDVENQEELFNLNYNGIIVNNDIYIRKEGLKVKVLSENKIYELKGGIDNQHWIDIS